MLRIKSLILITGILTGHFLFAQSPASQVLEGKVVDEKNKEALIGAHIRILNIKDSTQIAATIADIEGVFRIPLERGKKYLLEVGFMGYQRLYRPIITQETGSVHKLGTLLLKEDSRFLSEVIVESTAIVGENYGDTTAFNASAFKTRPDAATEDLIRKMPGITMENGQISAQGEVVQQVLVDGKIFFGDDAAAALKNLPAEIVEKIEVFDQLSEQSQFTGIDDGQTRKTINIVTREDARKGQFGKMYAGGGKDERYVGGGNVNFFNNDRRFSVIGLSNNINQQNFSSDDLLGVRGEDNQPRRGDDDFQVGQQPGITQTHALGLNFSDSWKKLDVSGSYFFNRAGNENWRERTREFFLPGQSQLQDDRSEFSSLNHNHRLNIRFEYKFNEKTSLIYRPRWSFQNNESDRMSNTVNALENGEMLSDSRNIRTYAGEGYNIGNFMLLRHRFEKKGRTFSVRFRTTHGANDRVSGLRALDRTFGESMMSDSVQQIRYNTGNNFLYNTRFSFTEGIGEKSMIEATYSFGNNKSESMQETFNHNFENQEYDILDTLLSNSFNNLFNTQTAGLNYSFNDKSWNINLGADYQNNRLDNQQVFPMDLMVVRRFENILPNTRIQYKLSKQTNLRFIYRTSTREPSIWELQDVVSVFSSVSLYQGNSNLNQQFQHFSSLRFSTMNPEKRKSFTLYTSGSVIDNYISNASLIARQDTLINEERLLVQGGQFRYPVNLDGFYNLRAYMAWGSYLKPLKTNLNLNTTVNFRRMPGMINQVQNLTYNTTLGQGFVLSSNISENLDFNFTSRADYNMVSNMLRPNLNNNFLVQTHRVDFFWRFWKDMFFDNNFAWLNYAGLADNINPNIALWNLGLGKKMMQDHSELKITIFDLLNQNNSIARDVTDVYVQDTQQLVLRQYYMLTFTYNLRRYNTKPPGSI
ncbi:MAG: outer membrane beta-barrel protein [Cyclobacteriaceae bacterium]|nr:outer membrane beta-barrel protein [Cyclobacteriaceae bacterium]